MSNQGFGGDDDDNRGDIERLLDGLSSAKQWYEENSDLFERFTEGGGKVDLAGGEPISEAHVNEDRVLIVADVSGVNATDLELSFYDGKVKGKLGNREFTVDVPNDVNEDSIEADMKNGVLRVELDRENEPNDSLTVETVEREEEDELDHESAVEDIDDMFNKDEDEEEENSEGDS